MNFKQLLKPVVAADHAAVKVVKIACGEPPAVKLYHWPQVGRNNGDDVQYHPFRLIAALNKRFNHLKTLNCVGALLALSGSFAYLRAEIFSQFLKVELLKQLLNCLSAHAYAEPLWRHAGCLTAVFHLSHELFMRYIGIARIKHHILCKIYDLFKRFWRHIQKHLHPARGSAEIPDMRNRGRKLYVAHTLTADLGFCHLNSAFVADNALMLYPLIASAVAFPVLRWSKYAFAEQPVLLGLERPIIYCFRLFNLTVRPLNYFFR